jgi:mRNA interferase RelE/StbE
MASQDIQVVQTSAFARAYKKLHHTRKLDVDGAVEKIVQEPLVGEPKRGDLAGTYLYKFKSQSQLVLLAYEFDPKTRFLLLLGSHENFYEQLKR